MKNKKDSLYSMHQNILHKDRSELSEKEKLEYERANQLNLPTLKLKEQVSTSSIFNFSNFLKAAPIIFVLVVMIPFLVPKNDEILYRSKGGANIRLFYKRNNKVKAIKKDTLLNNGDEVTAQLISNSSSKAYWYVIDDNKRVLSDYNDIMQSELILNPGILNAFNSSFKLVAPNEGESLIIVICENKIDDEDVQDHLMDQDVINRISKKGMIDKSLCVYFGHKLRSRGEK